MSIKRNKIWIVFFILINILLLLWALGYFTFFLNKLLKKEQIVTIAPELPFNKSLPPKDESFPNEGSKLWSGFEDNQSQVNLDTLEIEKTVKSNKKENLLKDSTKIDEESGKNKINNIVKNESLSSEIDKTIQTNEEKINYENEINKENKDNLKNQTKQNLTEKSKNERGIRNNKDLNEENNNTSKKKISYYVQIASLTERDLVKIEWDRLKKKYCADFNNLSYEVEEVKLKNKQTFFRILAMEFSDKKIAESFCNKIKIKNQCIIKKISK